MELIAIGIGLIEIVILPILLAVLAYKHFIPSSRGLGMFGKFILVAACYVVFTYLLALFMGILMMAGAHSDPPGLNVRGQLFVFGAVMIYTVLGWGMCSLIVGKPFGFPRRT